MNKDRKSIFVSGHNGFLGSHLVSSLQNEYEVKTFGGNLFEMPNDSFKDGINVFFHLAGLSTPAKCEESPDLAYEANLNLVQHILQNFSAEFEKNKTTFVFFSSAHVYTQSDEALTENSPLNPKSVYARSKLAAENVVRDLCFGRGIPYIVIRLFNTTHCSQTGPYFMPEVYTQMKKNLLDGKPDKSILTGKLNVVRDFLVLQDFIQAMRQIVIKATESNTPSGIFNLSSGIGKDLRHIVAALSAQMGVCFDEPHESDIISRLVGNSDLFQSLFSWQPLLSQDMEIFVRSFLSNIPHSEID